MLDSFFGSLSDDGDWARCISDRGFAQARNKLAWGGLERLNTFVVKSADALGLVARWHGLRLVAADASVLMPAIRPCHTTRRLASADQRLFALYLPGAELTFYASVHGTPGFDSSSPKIFPHSIEINDLEAYLAELCNGAN